MTNAEIAQLIVSIISVVASVGLSLFIFIRQVIIENGVKKQGIDNKTVNFVLENKEELNLLPLCQISNDLHKTDKHSHKIYETFNMQKKDVQDAILCHENIRGIIQVNDSVIGKAITNFMGIEKTYDMGRTMLYDCAKYLHRAYQRYRDEKIDNINPFVFKKPYPGFFPDSKYDLEGYLDNYFLHKINPNDDIVVSVEEKYFIPPMDLLYDGFNLGNCDEKVVCFWIMRYIISTCYVLNNRDLVIHKTLHGENLLVDEYSLTTYEDMYYYTIYILIETFSK